MVHEALGHGTVSWLTGDRILSISTVAIQNATASRLVAAAGTSANCLVVILSLLLLRRIRTFSSWTYFLWIFGAYNLLNSGYLVVSAALNNGDWANVIAGLSPPWLWRCVLGLAGATLYIFAIRWTASSMGDMVNRGEVAVVDLQRLVLPAYFAGGAVMTIASVFNPISPSLEWSQPRLAVMRSSLAHWRSVFSGWFWRSSSPAFSSESSGRACIFPVENEPETHRESSG
jgi:hypothetical protein